VSGAPPLGEGPPKNTVAGRDEAAREEDGRGERRLSLCEINQH